jgi:AhpD family alkylhydroperoxidase
LDQGVRTLAGMHDATEVPRIDVYRVWSDGYRALHALYRAVDSSGLEPALLDLLRMRVSQLNGCAYCLDMHSKDARARGETEQRLYALNAWRDTSFFTPRERAALALAESITFVAETHVPDAVIDEARRQFDERELAILVWASVEINAWNRLNVAARQPAGGYTSKVARDERAR